MGRELCELDIEFEPSRRWTRQFLQSLQLLWKLAATCNRHRPSEADIARERKLLQLAAARHLPVRSLPNLTRSPSGTWTRRLCAWFQQGWSKKGESTQVFASRAIVTVTLAANMRGGMWTQIVYEGRATQYTLTSQRSLASSCPTPRRTGSRKRHS